MVTLKNYDYPIETFISQAEKTSWTVPPHPACVKRRVYNMSTEITPSFMDKINLQNKRVLTVGSSGDQLLTYTLMGSRDITIMDANPLTPYYTYLKLEALKTISREEFIAFFTGSRTNPNFMNKETYKKIRANMNEPFLTFWDSLYSKNIYNKIFNLDGSLKLLPPYLSNDKNYEKVKELLLDVDITFVLSDFSNFHEYAEGEYDFIDFSNIYTYVTNEKFFKEIYNIYPHLSENGVFKLHYGDESLKDSFNLFNKSCVAISATEYDDASDFFIWQNSPEIKNEKK